LRNPYVDWGKTREFSVDFNVTIGHTLTFLNINDLHT
jgi:hypothetical protein